MSSHSTSIFHTPNLENIPNGAITHYSYMIYPIKPIIEKTNSGFARKTVHNRKTPNKNQPMITIITPATAAAVAAPKSKKNGSKFRKDIDKDALATYFDNERHIPESSQWLDDTIAELDAADARRAAANTAEQEELRRFVESKRAPAPQQVPYFQPMPELGAQYIYISIIDFVILIQEIISHVQQQSDNHRMAINESIVDRFVKKYNGADTAAAMRAWDRRQRNKTKLPYILHQLQITK